MDNQIETAVHWFRRIYLDGIPVLLQRNETAFLSFLCVAAATDALAGYRYQSVGVGDRFQSFVKEYFSSDYKPHANSLYFFRCRMLHNFSPAYFSLVHAKPEAHLQPSAIGDVILDDGTFFKDMSEAAERYFDQLRANSTFQNDMLKRLNDISNGGAIVVSAQ